MLARTLIASSLAVACSAAGAAQACSVGKRPAATAEKRTAGRTDLRRVAGTLRIERIEPPERDAEHYSLVHGRVTTKRGTVFVVYPYSEIWVDCLIYYLPQADASGRFWLRRRRGGGYELVDWSGEYIAGNGIVRRDEESTQ